MPLENGPGGDTTQHNTIKHNTHSTAQHNTAQHSTAQHNTTQHNTAQHSTAQHNTTQHNTTQHNTRVKKTGGNFATVLTLSCWPLPWNTLSTQCTTKCYLNCTGGQLIHQLRIHSSLIEIDAIHCLTCQASLHGQLHTLENAGNGPMTQTWHAHARKWKPYLNDSSVNMPRFEADF